MWFTHKKVPLDVHRSQKICQQPGCSTRPPHLRPTPPLKGCDRATDLRGVDWTQAEAELHSLPRGAGCDSTCYRAFYNQEAERSHCSLPHIGAQVFPTMERVRQALGQVVVVFSILFEALKMTKTQEGTRPQSRFYLCRLFAGACGRTSGSQCSGQHIGLDKIALKARH